MTSKARIDELMFDLVDCVGPIILNRDIATDVCIVAVMINKESSDPDDDRPLPRLEYQASDGLPGQRSSSFDLDTYEEAKAALPEMISIVEENSNALPETKVMTMTTKKTDREDTLRYVWLVTYRGRGDGEDGTLDAHEIYSDERVALRSIAAVLRLWCDDKGYITDEHVRKKLDSCLQRDAYSDAIGLWNHYASSTHEPRGEYRIDLKDVEFDATAHLNVKDDVYIRSVAARPHNVNEAPGICEINDTSFNPGYNKDGTHPFDDIFVAYKDGTYTCGPCVPKDVDISLDETDVWEVGSDGWLAPVVCRNCKRSIEVVVDGQGNVEDAFETKRVGSDHEETIRNDRSYCNICGFIDDCKPSPTVMAWHGDSFDVEENDEDRCPHGMFYSGAGACPACGQ